MSKSKKKINYDKYSREDLINRCETYRKQVGGLSANQQKFKSKYNKLEQLCISVFKEYVESHTWVDADENISLTIQEIPIIRDLKDQFDALHINYDIDFSEYDLNYGNESDSDENE